MMAKATIWSLRIDAPIMPTAKNKNPTLEDAHGIDTIGLRCAHPFKKGHLTVPMYPNYSDIEIKPKNYMADNRRLVNRLPIAFPKNDGYRVEIITCILFTNLKRHLIVPCDLRIHIKLQIGDCISFARGDILLYL